MQITHQFHGPLCGHVDAGIFQIQFEQTQIRQGYDATQEMASDFRISPVTDREHADQVIVLGLPKCFFHKISVQAGLNDRVSAPIGKVCDQDILAEPIDVSADSVIILTEFINEYSANILGRQGGNAKLKIFCTPFL